MKLNGYGYYQNTNQNIYNFYVLFYTNENETTFFDWWELAFVPFLFSVICELYAVCAPSLWCACMAWL